MASPFRCPTFVIKMYFPPALRAFIACLCLGVNSDQRIRFVIDVPVCVFRVESPNSDFYGTKRATEGDPNKLQNRDGTFRGLENVCVGSLLKFNLVRLCYFVQLIFPPKVDCCKLFYKGNMFGKWTISLRSRIFLSLLDNCEKIEAFPHTDYHKFRSL